MVGRRLDVNATEWPVVGQVRVRVRVTVRVRVRVRVRSARSDLSTPTPSPDLLSPKLKPKPAPNKAGHFDRNASDVHEFILPDGTTFWAQG